MEVKECNTVEGDHADDSLQNLLRWERNTTWRYKRQAVEEKASQEYRDS
jgi:hypothetical protein